MKSARVCEGLIAVYLLSLTPDFGRFFRSRWKNLPHRSRGRRVHTRKQLEKIARKTFFARKKDFISRVSRKRSGANRNGARTSASDEQNGLNETGERLGLHAKALTSRAGTIFDVLGKIKPQSSYVVRPEICVAVKRSRLTICKVP